MRSLQDNEMNSISGGDAATQVSEYYNEVDQSYKLSFALGGATASLACIVGVPATVSFSLFSLYALYLSAF